MYMSISLNFLRDNWQQVKPYFINKYARGLVLDIGCGNHEYIPYNINYIGLDIEKKKNNIIADAHYLPLRDNSIDTIILFDILEHSTYYGKIIEEAKRVSKANSIFLISVPYGDIYSADNDKTHCHTFTLITIKQALGHHNLEILEMYRYCPLLDNIIVIAKKKNSLN